MAPPPDDDDDKVGYGRPPKHTRFQKGKSGNPKGRPKNALNVRTILSEVLKQKVTATENGRTTKLNKLQALVVGNVNRGIKSDARAGKFVLDLVALHGIGAEEPTAHAPLSESDEAILERYAARLFEKLTTKKDD